MRTGLLLASVVMVCSGPASGHTIGDPTPVAAAPEVVKHELTLRKITRDHDSRRHGNRPLDSGQIDVEFYATGFESEWVSWRKSPDIARLTNNDGKSLLPPAVPGSRPTSGGTTGEWGTDEFGSFQRVSVELKNDQIDRFGVLEAVAEIEVAKDLEYLDLGELKGLDTKIELAPGVEMGFKANIGDKSFNYNTNTIYQDKHGTPKRLVGIETFDRDGKPCHKSGLEESGNSMQYLNLDGKPMPHTGRLVFAKRTERIPLRYSGRDVALGGMSLKDVETMTVETLQQKINAKQLSADDLSEVFMSSVQLWREDLANVLIDSSASTNGQFFISNRLWDGTRFHADFEALRDRLFLRQIEVAGRAQNKKTLQLALNTSLLYPYQKFIPQVLKWNPPLVWKEDDKRNTLIAMRVFGAMVPEIADAYANEVLTRGPDYEFASRDGFSEFLAAAYKGDHARLSAMIKAGADINQHTEFGENALGWACLSPHTNIETLKLLLDAGVSMNQGSDDRRTALNSALDGKRYDHAIELIRRGVLKKLKSGRWSDEIYPRCGESGSIELVRAILDNLHPMASRASSAILSSAARNGHDEIVRIAIQWVRQSQIDEKTQKELLDRAAIVAERAGKLDTAKILKEAGPK